MKKQSHSQFNLYKMLTEPRVDRNTFTSNKFQGELNHRKIMKSLEKIKHPIEFIPSHLWTGGLRKQTLALRKQIV